MPGMVSFQTERLDQFNDIFGLKTDDEFQGRYWPMTYLPCSGTKIIHYNPVCRQGSSFINIHE